MVVSREIRHMFIMIPYFLEDIANIHNPFWSLVIRNFCETFVSSTSVNIFAFLFPYLLDFLCIILFPDASPDLLSHRQPIFFFSQEHRNNSDVLLYTIQGVQTLCFYFPAHISGCFVISLNFYLTWHLRHLFFNCSGIRLDV